MKRSNKDSKPTRSRNQAAAQQKKRKPHRLRRWLVNILLLLLLLIGVALIFNDQIKDWLIQRNTDQYSIGNFSREDIENNLNADVTFDFDQVEPMSTEDILRDQFSSSDFAIIGAIALPDVSINLPIFKGVEYNSLFYGAGTTSPDQLMGEGNYGLASHRAINPDLLFSPLEKSTIGEMIYLTDLAHVYAYQIYSIERVPPSAGYVLNEVENRKIVTLVTCGENSDTQRLIVQGELQEVTTMEETSAGVLSAFNLSVNTY